MKTSLVLTTHLFADDCLVYNTIESPGDEQQLQTDLNKMVDWAQTYGAPSVL